MDTVIEVTYRCGHTGADTFWEPDDEDRDRHPDYDRAAYQAGTKEEAAAKWSPVCAERYAHVPHFRCHLLSGRHDDRKTTNGEAKSDHSKIEWTGARLGRFLREAAELFNALERLRKGGE
jgi:hypothetical protein